MRNKYVSVICVLIKNEQRYIKEWVEYNLNIGFTKLYIFEDFDSTSHIQQLKKYIDAGCVELIPLINNKFGIIKGDCIHGNIPQYQVFNYFFSECKKGHIYADWIGFFDPDEFLMFDNGYDLNKLEKEFDTFGGILPCWVMYGANGHIKRPEGRVVDNYTKPMPLTYMFECSKWNHKSLVNVKNCDGLKTIHTFNYCVFTDKNSVFNPKTSFAKCHLNHYFTKSWEDFCERMESRGNMSNNHRSYDDFFKLSPEFKPMELDMLKERTKNTKVSDTMYISHKYKIIKGGNVDKVNRIRKLNSCG